MVEIIEIIGEFDVENVTDVEYNEEVEKVLSHFPPSEHNEDVRRTKTHEDIRKKIDEFFFLKFKSKGSDEGILCLYSYISAYLLGIAYEKTLFVLDPLELNLPDELLNGRELFDTQITVKYTAIPVMRCGNLYSLVDALECFERGRAGFDHKWWRRSVSTMIGFTSEVLRFRVLRDKLKIVFRGEYETVYLTEEDLFLVSNWGKISKFLNQGKAFHLILGVPRPRAYVLLCVSLVTPKDGLTRKTNSPAPLPPTRLPRRPISPPILPPHPPPRSSQATLRLPIMKRNSIFKVWPQPIIYGKRKVLEFHATTVNFGPKASFICI